MTKWFISYVRVYDAGVCKIGHCVYSGEHPVLKVIEMNRVGAVPVDNTTYDVILFSFFEVGSDLPEQDKLSNYLSCT
jgi:hypothetical protein